MSQNDFSNVFSILVCCVANIFAKCLSLWCDKYISSLIQFALLLFNFASVSQLCLFFSCLIVIHLIIFGGNRIICVNCLHSGDVSQAGALYFIVDNFYRFIFLRDIREITFVFNFISDASHTGDHILRYLYFLCCFS